MKRLTWIAGTVAAVVLVLTGSASARLGIAPLSVQSVQDDSVVQVRGHRGGRGHHYGWGRAADIITAGAITAIATGTEAKKPGASRASFRSVSRAAAHAARSRRRLPQRSILLRYRRYDILSLRRTD
jgi:hypothetical protein